MAMAQRSPNSSARPRSPGTAVWFLPAAALFLVVLFRWPSMGSYPPVSPRGSGSVPARRAELYSKMARDIDERGAAFLRGGETSQSLTLSDLFDTGDDGAVVPRLKAANPPVRANVLYLDPEFATVISKAVKETFLPYFDQVIWFQNTTMYHFSMFHASHHLEPIVATDDEIQAEVEAVKRVTKTVCPLKIVLDRVVLTSTGVLLGLWQVESGTDPAEIRSRLREALPRAPQKQLYDPVLLHTSFARILGHPKLPEEQSAPSFDHVKFFHGLVAQVNEKIHGFQATVSELWYVEEYDVLALVLNGKMKVRRLHLGCNHQGNENS
ncbi:uncharacterized protein LOC120679644 [Panicum virgatum]|uniref:Uncharacterized protein n=1 Tax=Panicum virgatum TaxID=38727 RepID=A0A8T0QVV8_PANVG|nr:uncharacterized protein LOC120679644 [Panicum virgatum]KAG2577033.1 hypothetical protein PVAP13_6NG076800 [Panicum virgatum]